MLNIRKVDENFKDEFNIARQQGFNVYCMDIENIRTSRIYPAFEKTSKVIYRGWMLNQECYKQLEQRFGESLLTSLKTYLNAHYLPNWYPYIKELTIPSTITDEDHATTAFAKSYKKAFLKDYVKSLKTGRGSVIENTLELEQTIKNMKHYRGAIEGGIVLREFVRLIPNTEIRYFVMKNKIFAPSNNIKKQLLVKEAVERLKQSEMPFFSIDVATLENGQEVVIEIGDGQVSDYVGWKVSDFVDILRYAE